MLLVLLDPARDSPGVHRGDRNASAESQWRGMPETPFSNRPRPSSIPHETPHSPTNAGVLDDATLRELIPRVLFTNLFLVTLPPGSLGPMRATETEKAQKDEFEGWRQPSFYQTGEHLYAFGPGVEQFTDRRFTSSIVTAETNRNFTKYLLGYGLMEFFRDREFVVKRDMQGFTVQDHNNVIQSSKKGVLHIIPQFNFQPYWVEATGGSIRFAFSIEPGTTTLPTFHIHAGLARFAAELDGLKLQLREEGCKPGCPLFGRKGEVLGRFNGFALRGAALDCTCHTASFDAVPIQVIDRRRKPGTPRRRRGGPKPEMEETVLTIPGQLVGATPSQRRLLRLSEDRNDLERAGRVWLGDLSTGGSVRGNALKVRYERIQEFLGRMAESEAGPISFTLPTGASVEMERLPLTLEELADAS